MVRWRVFPRSPTCLEVQVFSLVWGLSVLSLKLTRDKQQNWFLLSRACTVRILVWIMEFEYLSVRLMGEWKSGLYGACSQVTNIEPSCQWLEFPVSWKSKNLKRGWHWNWDRSFVIDLFEDFEYSSCHAWFECLGQERWGFQVFLVEGRDVVAQLYSLFMQWLSSKKNIAAQRVQRLIMSALYTFNANTWWTYSIPTLAKYTRQLPHILQLIWSWHTTSPTPRQQHTYSHIMVFWMSGYGLANLELSSQLFACLGCWDWGIGCCISIWPV